MLDSDVAIKKVLVFLKTIVAKTTDDKGQKNIKLEDLRIPDKLRRKRGCIRLTEEDMKDEHIKYILKK